jgi:hypothetical protein
MPARFAGLCSGARWLNERTAAITVSSTPDGRGEPLSAVHYPVTGPEQVSGDVPGSGQLIQHQGYHRPVGAFGKSLLGRCCREPLDPQQGLRRAQPLANPAHETLAAPRKHQRELD